MTQHSTDFVGRAYAAALDDRLWTDWAHDLIFALGGAGGTFMVWDDRSAIRTAQAFGIKDDAYDQYLSDWWARDPQVPMALGMKRSGRYLDSDHLDMSVKDTADYMKWQGAKSGWHHHMTGVVLLGQRGARATLSIHRPRDRGPASPREQASLDALLPDAVRALNLGFQYAEMLQQAFWDGVQARQRDVAAILLDDRGLAIRTTARAEELLSQADGLEMLEGRLFSRQAAEEEALRALIGRAVAPDDARSGAMRIARRGGGAPVVLTILPLVRSHRMLAPVEAAAIVTIADPGAANAADHDLYRQAFGFSPREADTALMLMQGHSVESAAACLGLSVPTARIHVRRLLEKTGAARQSELVRILASIG